MAAQDVTVKVKVIPRWRYLGISYRAHVVAEEQFEIVFVLSNTGTQTIPKGTLDFKINWGQSGTPIKEQVEYDQIPARQDVHAKKLLKAELPGIAILQDVRPSTGLGPTDYQWPFHVLDRAITLTGFHNVIILTIGIIALLASVGIAIYPQFTAVPNIVFELDPEPGKIRDSIYDLGRRNLEGPTSAKLVVRLHNIGSEPANNLTVRLAAPGWINFGHATGYLPDLRPYNSREGLANQFIVHILKPGDSGEIDFGFSVNGTRYDQVSAESVPSITLRVDYLGDWKPWPPWGHYTVERTYQFKMP